MNKICLACSKRFHTILSRVKIGKGKFCSQQCYWQNKKGRSTWNKGIKGYKQPNISKSLKGKKPSVETLRKMQLSHIGLMLGEKNPMWKGGLTSQNRTIRNSFAYKEWRKNVFERDNYTCQFCNKRGGIKLHADHIKPFAFYPKLRLDINNGRTLCKPCHQTTDTYRRKYA